MCSFLGAYVCSLLFAIVDMIQGFSVMVFYSYQQHIHRYCTYSHGVLFCEYFLFKSNHSQRTKIGIGEGIVCILISALLIYLIYKRKGMLVWGWLFKPCVVTILNLYYVVNWLIRKGRYYHTYDTQEEVEQEMLFIYFGAFTAFSQVVLALWFCCTAGGFSYHVRRRRQQLYSSCETKV